MKGLLTQEERPRLVDCEGSGGPGRGRSQRSVGTVKAAHHMPTRKRMTRMGSVGLFLARPSLLKRIMTPILKNWNPTAAA